MANTTLPQARLPISEDGTTFSLPWLRFFQSLSSGTIDPAVIAALEAEIAAAEAAAAAAQATADEALAIAEAAGDGVTANYGIAFAALDEPFVRVGLSVPSILNVTGSPVYSVGTLAVGLATQTANTFFAGPTTGSPATPTFRIATLASADFVNQGTTHTVLHGNAAGNPSWSAIDLTADVSGILPFGNGGTGNSSYTDGQLLIGNTGTGGLTKATLTPGTNVTISNAGGAITINATGGTGTVSSVASADGSINVTNPTTTVDLAVVKSPKLTTARTIAMSGDVVWSTSFDGSGNVTAAGTIQSNAVTTSKINNSAVTLAKIANAAANSVLVGSGAAGSGAAYAEITLGTGLTMTGTTLSASGGSGTVTTTGSPASGNLTKFSGSTSITSGDLSGDVTTSGTLATTIASNAVTTAKINNSAVTYAKIQNVSANSVLLGAGASGSGAAPTEIALGTGLSMSGTTLQATGAGSIGALVLITETVTSASQASVTFSSIPSTYRDLVVVVRGRGDTASAVARVLIQLNGDTGSNYSWSFTQNTGTGSMASEYHPSVANMELGYITAATSPLLANASCKA